MNRTFFRPSTAEAKLAPTTTIAAESSTVGEDTSLHWYFMGVIIRFIATKLVREQASKSHSARTINDKMIRRMSLAKFDSRLLDW
jgi:hypothetical protein